jgi:predicted MarR family transcription regulator
MSKEINHDTLRNDHLHEHWALGDTHHDIALTEFEWTIMRFFNAFERCVVQMANMEGSSNLNTQEVIILHVVSMQKVPQTSASLSRQLNRDDVANIQYTLRKLSTAGLTEKQKDPRGKTYTYKMTALGTEHVKQYANFRKVLLSDKTKIIDDIDKKLDDSRRFIGLLTGIYDEVARESPTYSLPNS